VNQLGLVQAIGAVNEKIEGFFDICATRGLTGRQGVLIPAANVQHLVLRPRVVEAVRLGRFRIWPVQRIDEGIALLTGRPAGARGDDGRYPDGSVNALVEARLESFAHARKRFLESAREEEADPPHDSD
jgi:predicted ATP-dependent protease